MIFSEPLRTWVGRHEIVQKIVVQVPRPPPISLQARDRLEQDRMRAPLSLRHEFVRLWSALADLKGDGGRWRRGPFVTLVKEGLWTLLLFHQENPKPGRRFTPCLLSFISNAFGLNLSHISWHIYTHISLLFVPHDSLLSSTRGFAYAMYFVPLVPPYKLLSSHLQPYHAWWLDFGSLNTGVFLDS